MHNLTKIIARASYNARPTTITTPDGPVTFTWEEAPAGARLDHERVAEDVRKELEPALAQHIEQAVAAAAQGTAKAISDVMRRTAAGEVPMSAEQMGALASTTSWADWIDRKYGIDREASDGGL